MSVKVSMRSDITLIDSIGMKQSFGRPTHRATSKGGDAPILQMFTFLKVIAGILTLWAKLLLFPLVRWNVASIAMFIFMRGLPFGRRFEGLMRLSYNIAMMEMGG
ncbi:hypothetical protein LZ32DRAFT_405701 [Colletotrichum eremochloae]|nr:hypothetical protein LZ32DRAFT_405701 [Colletotrichum eremochloae]